MIRKNNLVGVAAIVGVTIMFCQMVSCVKNRDASYDYYNHQLKLQALEKLKHE